MEYSISSYLNGQGKGSGALPGKMMDQGLLKNKLEGYFSFLQPLEGVLKLWGPILPFRNPAGEGNLYLTKLT